MFTTTTSTIYCTDAVADILRQIEALPAVVEATPGEKPADTVIAAIRADLAAANAKIADLELAAANGKATELQLQKDLAKANATIAKKRCHSQTRWQSGMRPEKRIDRSLY